jgi:hypothetical protein
LGDILDKKNLTKWVQEGVPNAWSLVIPTDQFNGIYLYLFLGVRGELIQNLLTRWSRLLNKYLYRNRGQKNVVVLGECQVKLLTTGKVS